MTPTRSTHEHLTHQLDDLLALQHGIITRSQALGLGVPAYVIPDRLRADRWRRLHSGVYATFTGEPSREASLWATVLRAGPGAALSHRTAAELYRISGASSGRIHVTIPMGRRVRAIEGAVIHRSSDIDRTRHPALAPPRTRIEDTILDLVDSSPTVDDAIHWLCAGCGGRLTTARRLAAAARARSRLRWREAVREALPEIARGAHSNLEYRYIRGVERPHGLPAAKRQVRATQGGRNQYRDNLYEEYALCVELDGQASHPAAERWRDIRRDNAAAALGNRTLRYGWGDVAGYPCRVAVEVALVLRLGGWTGTLRRCGPSCTAPAWAAAMRLTNGPPMSR